MQKRRKERSILKISKNRLDDRRTESQKSLAGCVRLKKSTELEKKILEAIKEAKICK